MRVPLLLKARLTNVHALMRGSRRLGAVQAVQVADLQRTEEDGLAARYVRAGHNR